MRDRRPAAARVPSPRAHGESCRQCLRPVRSGCRPDRRAGRFACFQPSSARSFPVKRQRRSVARWPEPGRSDSAVGMSGKAETPTPQAPSVDRVGLIALLAGTAIIAWSGILVRFLDVGPLAGAAWRMGLAVPALAVWAKAAGRDRQRAPNLWAVAVPLVLAGLAFAVDVDSFHFAIFG